MFTFADRARTRRLGAGVVSLRYSRLVVASLESHGSIVRSDRGSQTWFQVNENAAKIFHGSKRMTKESAGIVEREDTLRGSASKVR